MLKANPHAAARRSRRFNRGKHGVHPRILLAVGLLGLFLIFPRTLVHAAGQARVTAIDGLNLRAGPSTEVAVLAVMPYGSVVTVQGVAAGAWLEVLYSGSDGFADGAYLEFGSTATAPAVATASAASAVVAPADGLRLHAGPAIGAAVIATLPSGRLVQLIGGTTPDGWQQVSAPEGTGWVVATYLQPLGAGAIPVLVRWYGHEFDGGVLACGGTYSADDPGVAATNDWPCGIRLSVCALGKCVTVTVRDRGGMETGAMDLSQAAFAKLAPLDGGPIHATLQVLPAAPAGR